MGGAVAEQGFVPVDVCAAFRASGVGKTVEVIGAFSAGEFFQWGGVTPGEFKLAGGADGIGLPAKIVAATGAADVKVNQMPRR